jgi:hypothetical protein
MALIIPSSHEDGPYNLDSIELTCVLATIGMGIGVEEITRGIMKDNRPDGVIF